jgi:hypothetical protein
MIIPIRKKAATEMIAGRWLPNVVDIMPKIRGPSMADDFPTKE